MKVTIVSAYSWSVPGGVNAHIEGLAAALRGRGHEVRIVAPSDGPVPSGVVRVGRTAGVPYNGSVARITFGPRAIARVRVALRRADPDVVHVHEPLTPSVSMIAALAARVPVVGTFHASAPESRLLRAARPALAPVWRRLSARIAVSAAARATFEDVFGADPSMRVIPNGVSVARFAAVEAAGPGEPTVVFFGRFERRKGAHVLAAAIPSLLERAPGTKVVFAGDGPARRSVEESIPASLREHVEFAGAVRPQDIPALHARASVMCFPSLGGESFGIVLLEAMASGRPVVASAITGYSALIDDGVEGLLVPPGDAGALAGALAAILADPDAAVAMGRKGRARAAAFDWDVLAARVEEVYEAARLGERRRRR